MIKVINFTIKIILSLLAIFMWWINIIVVLIMWDGKFMVVHSLFGNGLYTLLPIVIFERWQMPQRANYIQL